MNNNFVLLKQSYPVSRKDRYCDGYKYIMEYSHANDRKECGIDDNDIPKIIEMGERYLYRVGKENGEFKTMSISLKNFEIIRNFSYIFDVE